MADFDVKTAAMTCIPDGNGTVDDYIAVATTAPMAYDYGFTIPCGTLRTGWLDDRIGGLRIVLIPEHRAATQTDRYLSGMYLVIGMEVE